MWDQISWASLLEEGWHTFFFRALQNPNGALSQSTLFLLHKSYPTFVSLLIQVTQYLFPYLFLLKPPSCFPIQFFGFLSLQSIHTPSLPQNTSTYKQHSRLLSEYWRLGLCCIDVLWTVNSSSTLLTSCRLSRLCWALICCPYTASHGQELSLRGLPPG